MIQWRIFAAIREESTTPAASAAAGKMGELFILCLMVPATTPRMDCSSVVSYVERGSAERGEALRRVFILRRRGKRVKLVFAAFLCVCAWEDFREKKISVLFLWAAASVAAAWTAGYYIIY